MEANLTAEKLIYYQLNGYTLYSLPKYRQIASGILIGVRKSRCAEFKIVKEMGNSEDKSEIVKVNVRKKGNNFTIYAIYSPPEKQARLHIPLCCQQNHNDWGFQCASP
jgi:hypothetical protein